MITYIYKTVRYDCGYVDTTCFLHTTVAARNERQKKRHTENHLRE